MELQELINEIGAGISEGQALAQAAEAARAEARAWALRLVRKSSPFEARALGRRAESGDLPSSPLLGALVILAASGKPEAAEALRMIGVRHGFVEIGARGTAVITAVGRGAIVKRVIVKFDPPAGSRGAWFRWEDKQEAPNAPNPEAPTASAASSVGARARIKRAR